MKSHLVSKCPCKTCLAGGSVVQVWRAYGQFLGKFSSLKNGDYKCVKLSMNQCLPRGWAGMTGQRGGLDSARGKGEARITYVVFRMSRLSEWVKTR
jgi:hypothetical protein